MWRLCSFCRRFLTLVSSTSPLQLYFMYFSVHPICRQFTVTFSFLLHFTLSSILSNTDIAVFHIQWKLRRFCLFCRMSPLVTWRLWLKHKRILRGTLQDLGRTHLNAETKSRIRRNHYITNFAEGKRRGYVPTCVCLSVCPLELLEKLWKYFAEFLEGCGVPQRKVDWVWSRSVSRNV